MPNGDAHWWLRLQHEASSCPACGSPRITLLDVLSIPKSVHGNRVAFLTGCRSCGLLFANPLPRQDELHQYYQPEGPWAVRRAERMRRIKAVDARWRQSGKSRPKADLPRKSRSLFDALSPFAPVYEPPPGARLLDFGCGDGKFLNRFQDLGWETFGVEPSTEAAFLRHQRLFGLPLDGSFDFIFLNHVLEHIDSPLALLQQLASTLRVGGVLFVSVPRVDTLPMHGDFDYCISGRRHVMCFSELCLRGLLARAGFSTSARLDSDELDGLFSEGKPLRLRLVAVRTLSPDSVPTEPLAPAVDVLRRYARLTESRASRVRRLLPVRIRGGLAERSAARRVLERRRAGLAASLPHEAGGD